MIIGDIIIYIIAGLFILLCLFLLFLGWLFGEAFKSKFEEEQEAIRKYREKEQSKKE